MRTDDLTTVHPHDGILEALGPAKQAVPAAVVDAIAARRAELIASIRPPACDKEDQMINDLVECLDIVPDEDPTGAGKMVLELMAAWSTGRRMWDKDFLAAGVAMAMPEARDVVWRGLTRDMAKAYLGFWVEVLKRTPSGVRVAVLGVTGVFAWIAGDAPWVDVCLEEAKVADKDFPLVRLLSQMVSSHLSPDQWEVVVESSVNR